MIRLLRVIRAGFGRPTIGFLLWILVVLVTSPGVSFTPSASTRRVNFAVRSSSGSSVSPSTTMFSMAGLVSGR